jgi:alanine-synthesizing transaminase
MKVSERTSGVEYVIRDIISYARKYEDTGKPITYLNIGDPVRYGFKTPPHIKQALIAAVTNDQNYYAESEGAPELREAIVEKESQKGFSLCEGDVLVTNGVSEGLDMILASIVDPGTEVLMPGPHYPPYASYTKFYGGRPIEFKLYPDGRPDVEDVASKINSKSRAICIISPNNPTGEVFDRKGLQQIVDLASEHNLYVICDEIYDNIIFDEQFTGIGRVARDAPVILLNGFSKAYLMTGWRCGYLCLNARSRKLDSLRENVAKLARVRISSNLPVQLAAAQALRGPQDHIQDMVHKLRKRRDYVVKRLNAIDGVFCNLPRGAFYVFPKVDLHGRWRDDNEFVLNYLHSTGVLTVPGSGFGKKFGAGHFRIVYLPQISILEEAMNKLESFMSKSCK